MGLRNSNETGSAAPVQASISFLHCNVPSGWTEVKGDRSCLKAVCTVMEVSFRALSLRGALHSKSSAVTGICALRLHQRKR